MVGSVKSWVQGLFHDLMGFADYGVTEERYRRLRKNMVILGVLGSMLPLLLMAMVNYHQYQKALAAEVMQPLRVLVNKTEHSFELFLAERSSAVNFIASAYSFQELADEQTLNRIFRVMKTEFGGFVDLGLIDAAGVQVGYAGPYQLKGKDYADQTWFHEVQVRGTPRGRRSCSSLSGCERACARLGGTSLLRGVRSIRGPVAQVAGLR